MRSLPLPCALAILLTFTACGGSDEALSPTPTAQCAPTQTPSGWPAESGVLHIDAPLPSVPFTPAAHRAFPVLDVTDPVVLTAPKIVTIIADGDPLADQLFAFADAAATSQWWTAVAKEYGIAAPKGGIHLRGPAMPAAPHGSDLVTYVKNVIAGAGSEAQADGQTIFLIFLSPGVEVVEGGNQNCGCAFASGAHFAMEKGKTNAIAWVQRCSSTDVEGLTVTASHELIEAATDPKVTGGYVMYAGKQPWNQTVWAGIQQGGNELGDWCTGTRGHEGAWEYQRSWSNLVATTGGDPCVPALDEPYYNVTADQDWYPIKSGETVTVELTGWATAPREDWFVYPRFASVTQQGFTTAIESDESADADGVKFYGINNGKKATLTVTAPDAPSGTFAVVRVLSRPSAPESDNYHFWPIGFYIP